jgi:uncharacterized membrane protein
MNIFTRSMVLATVLALPTLAHAQTAPATPPATQQAQPGTPDQKRMIIIRKMKQGGGGGAMMGMRMRDVMEKLSPEGQAIMQASMKAQMDQGKADQEKLRATREKILLAMDADKFDATALRRAFAEERALSQQGQERKHEGMVAAMSKLSGADRKIITANLKEMRDKMQMRLQKRGMGQGSQMGQMGEPGQMDMPPPPPRN